MQQLTSHLRNCIFFLTKFQGNLEIEYTVVEVGIYFNYETEPLQSITLL